MRISPVRILIVEDFEPWVHYVSTLIKEDPSLIIVETVREGHQAIREAASLEPDLVLLDVNLPGLSGIEVGRQIREVNPDCQLLFMSNNCSRTVVDAAFEVGATGYLFKGDMLELLRAIASVLEGKRYLSRTVRAFAL